MSGVNFNKFDERPHGRSASAALGDGGYRQVLAELLAQVEPVDFRARAGLSEGDKVPRKICVVVAIDEMAALAEANDWGICTRDGFVYVFGGSYWQPVDTDEFKRFLSDAAERMGVPTLDARYHNFRDEIYKQFLAVSWLPTPEAGDTTLINMLNGTFEISADKQGVRKPRREDFIKYQLPFAFDPDAECPIFDKYLAQVLPDAGCRAVLAEYLGYVFIRPKVLKLEKVLILYGVGANGKSVFFDIVNALLGSDNVCSYSLHNITKHDGYQRAELSNKLVNYASEINGKLETSVFKQMASGEPVEARQIYGKPFLMHEYAKLIFNCNELPRETEQTNAFFRRFIIVPFDQTIPEEDQDPELSTKIISSELSGVFNWVLDGLGRLLGQKKFTPSEKVKEQIETYRRESDSVAMFIEDEGYETHLTARISLKYLYGEYRQYCDDCGYRPVAIRKVAARLRANGFETEKRKEGVVIYARQRGEGK